MQSEVSREKLSVSQTQSFYYLIPKVMHRLRHDFHSFPHRRLLIKNNMISFRVRLNISGSTYDLTTSRREGGRGKEIKRTLALEKLILKCPSTFGSAGGSTRSVAKNQLGAVITPASASLDHNFVSVVSGSSGEGLGILSKCNLSWSMRGEQSVKNI